MSGQNKQTIHLAAYNLWGGSMRRFAATVLLALLFLFVQGAGTVEAGRVQRPVAARPTVNGAITISRSKYPQSAQHILDAQRAGHPKELTINRTGAKDNRKQSLQGIKTKLGKDRDEYPPAMFKEGGRGASVRHIDPGDNRGAGACMGIQCRGFNNGDKVRIKVTK